MMIRKLLVNKRRSALEKYLTTDEMKLLIQIEDDMKNSNIHYKHIKKKGGI